MKLVRPLLVTLGILCALTALALGLALLPAVQGWAARRYLAGHPALKLQFDSLAVGLTGARLVGVKLEQHGIMVTLERAEVEFSAWQYLAHRRVVVPRLAVSGLRLDATRLSTERAQAGAVAAPVAAPGAMARVQLPWTVEIGEVRVAGQATLPGGPGRAALQAEFQIDGGGIAPDKEGTLLLKAKVTDPTPAAPVTGLRAEARLAVRETEARMFDRASLTLVLDAEGSQFSDGHRLKLVADMQAAGAAEKLSLALDTQQAGRNANLLKIEATLPLDRTEGSGTWQVQASDAQIEPFFLGAQLPRGEVTGGGDFAFDVRTRAVALKGRVSGQLSGLQVLDPSLRAIGTVRVQSEFDVAAEHTLVRLNRLQLRLEGEQPILSLETKQPLAWDRLSGTIHLASAGTGPLARLSIAQLPLSWLRPFVTAADVSGGGLQGEWLLEGEGERLQLRSIAPVRIDSLTVVKSGRRLIDRAAISLQTQMAVAPAAASLSLREISVRTPAGDSIAAEAQLELAPKDAAITVRGHLAADLPRLIEPFAPVGPVQLKGDVDATVGKSAVELRSFHGTLADGAGRMLLTAEVTRPAIFDRQSLQVQAAGTGPVEIGRVSLGALDLGAMPLVQALLPLRGQLEAGTLLVAVESGRMAVKPAAPLRLRELTVLGAMRRPFLDRVTVEASPVLEFSSPANWRVATGDTLVASREKSVWLNSAVEVKATEAEGLRASVTFNADLAAMAAQPAFAALRALSSGRASGEVRGALAGHTLQLEGRSTLNSLVLRESTQPLPVANLSFRIARTPDKRVTLEMPLLLDRLGQRSDLKLTAEAIRRGDGILFDANVAGEHIELGDLLALLELAGAPVEAASGVPTPAAAPGSGARDLRPFWSGLRGEIALDVKSITQGKDWTMTGLNGFVAIDPQRVAIQQLQGVINEKSRLGARADLRFGEGEAPYRLSGNFSLTDFDVGAFLKAFDPGKPPMLDGVFTVAGGFGGDGATLDRTLERTRGQFQLTSRQGVFRGLKRTTEKVSVATKAVDAVAALGALFGSDKVKGAAEKVAGQSYQVDQLALALAELPFDQFVVRVNRDDALNLKVDEFTLLSPEIRLIGRGAVTYVAGKPLLEQPLSLSYQLAARGKVEQLLGKMRMLDGTKDDLGYARMKDAGTIGGTLGRPDPSALFVKLAQSKLVDFLN